MESLFLLRMIIFDKIGQKGYISIKDKTKFGKIVDCSVLPY